MRRLTHANSLLASAIVSFVCLNSTPTFAGFRANDEGWEGTSELLEIARKKLGRERVLLAPSLDFAALTPSDGVLILAPQIELDYAEISAFLRAGGRLAVLDDYGTGARLLERFQIRRIPAPLRPARALRNNSQLAIAVPTVQQVAGHEQGRHPVVANLEQLVTNHPTGLTHPNLTPVLKIPALGEPDVTLAVTGIIVDRGRLFAMGDPSALINLMLRYPGNRAFADGLVSYLVEADAWGARGGRLFLLAGTFKQQGRYGGGSGLLHEVTDRFEAFAESIAEIRRAGLPGALAVLFAALTALAAAVWSALRFMRIYRRATPSYALASPLVGQGGVAGRAAVLAAPSTHPSLALVELKTALEELISERLGMERGASSSALLAEIHRQGLLDQQSSQELELLFRQLNQAESQILASAPARVSKTSVESLHARVTKLVSALNAARGGPS